MPQSEHSPARPGRLRSAWAVLRGVEVTPRQIQAEWLEYKQIFDDLLERLSMQLARQARMHKRTLKRQLDNALEEPKPPAQRDLPLDRESLKAQLRATVAQARAVGRIPTRHVTTPSQEHTS